MATKAHTLWLAAKWARFSCNDQALLGGCPKHIQSVINLIVNILMDIYVLVKWQWSKRVLMGLQNKQMTQCFLRLGRKNTVL